jgi:uncharacterized protein YdeI (YjbR/CyaY-like superfamily)
MEIKKTLYLTNRKEWRSWLSKNYNKEKEIWLIYYYKDTRKKRIPYNDAVEEALCYGWIDSTVKKIDEERFAQRFTPRRAKSVLSEMNKERIKKLIKNKKMKSIGLKAVEHAFDINEKFVISQDIINILKNNKEVWKNFNNFSESYKRVRIGYIENSRDNKEIFKKRLNHFIKKTEKNIKFGMMQ